MSIDPGLVVEFYSPRGKMLPVTQIRANKLLFWHDRGSGPSGCEWLRPAPRAAHPAGLPLCPSVQDALGGNGKCFQTALQLKLEVHLFWRDCFFSWSSKCQPDSVWCPLCKPSNLLGSRWKLRSFCPQKHVDLQHGAGWPCFVGMSVCWSVRWRHFDFIDVLVEAK